MTCNDCIHFDACRNILEAFCPEYKGKSITFTKTCKHFKNKADVAEVKHGEWTKVDTMGNGYGQIYYQHKECPVSSTELFTCPYEYCPRCGAKMDGKKEGR